MRHGLLLCAVLCAVSLLSCNGRDDTVPAQVSEVCDTLPCDTVRRTAITFIMGEDNSLYNQYYTLAGYYYRLNPEERTEVVVEGLTSLSQLLDYLSKHPTENGLPYGLVNIVSHGNEFVDLQMKVVPGGRRTSAEALFDAMLDGTLVPPESGVVDSQTVVFLHGCAVGNNQVLLNVLARTFGDENGVRVKASKLFEYYAYLSQNKNPISVRHYYARTWYAFYHPDSVMDEQAMVRQLRQRYPNDTTHWLEGLRRRFQNNPSELYHSSFEVPCTYEEVYGVGERLPAVNGPQQRRQWLKEHPEFAELMAVTHIPQQYFQLKFYRRTYLTEDEELLYGLVAKARAGVVCFIQPLTTTDTLGTPFVPYCPEDSDSSIFAYSTLRPTRVAGPLREAEKGDGWREFLLYQKKNVSL